MHICSQNILFVAYATILGCFSDSNYLSDAPIQKKVQNAEPRKTFA